MNNLREERERIKIQKLLYKQNKLIREQKEKESNNTPVVLLTKTKKKLDISSSKGQFSSIPIEKLNDNSTTEDVSLTDMLGIKSNDTIVNKVIDNNSNDENEKSRLEENDRHYAPDFI
jgi:hypothetical protein